MSVEEIKHLGLAIDPLLTSRYSRRAGGTLKSVEKPKKNILTLKSFNLERSLRKINVLQTRNYLKKPYMQSNISVVNYTENSLVEKKEQNEEISSGSDELAEVEDIFENNLEPAVKKLEVPVQAGRVENLMLTNVKNSFNKGFNRVDYDIN